MRQVKIGLANVDTTVGAFVSNVDKMLEFAEEMANKDCTIGVFQEQVIGGYPAEDLVQWPGFVKGQWKALNDFARNTYWHETIFTLGLTVQVGGNLYNCVAVVHRGKILGIVPKQKLPTYDIFYEMRTFSQGVPGMVSEIKGIPFGDLIFEFPFGIMAVEVCEDVWSPDGPLKAHAYSGAEIIVNVSSSPWRIGVVDTRKEMISTRAGDNQATVVYTNQVGGQDSLVFDGGGFVCQNGRMLLEAKRWRESLSTMIVDLDVTAQLRESNTTWRNDYQSFITHNQPTKKLVCFDQEELDNDLNKPYEDFLQLQSFLKESPGNKQPFIPIIKENKIDDFFDDLLSAMMTALKGYFEKTGAFDCIGIALSGGRDSVLTLIVAWLYAKEKFANDPDKETKIKEFIHCFSMPSRYNSEATKSISQKACEELGVSFTEISIQEAFEREIEATRQMLGDLEPTPITLQNIQARIRQERMWNWSNTARGFLVQTGNMSEKAVGYTTMGGDLMGCFSLIGNLPKTTVNALLRYLGQKLNLTFVEELLATPASAELAENQQDERDLMPFEVLDNCIHLFAGERLMPSEIYLRIRALWTDEELLELYPTYQTGMVVTWVKRFINLFVHSIYKWVQAPQSAHLGRLELDRERALQLPVVQSMEWLAEDLEEIDRMVEREQGN